MREDFSKSDRKDESLASGRYEDLYTLQNKDKQPNLKRT